MLAGGASCLPEVCVFTPPTVQPIVPCALCAAGTLFGPSGKPVLDPTGTICPFCDAAGAWLPLLCTLNCTGVAEEVGGIVVRAMCRDRQPRLHTGARLSCQLPAWFTLTPQQACPHQAVPPPCAAAVGVAHHAVLPAGAALVWDEPRGHHGGGRHRAHRLLRGHLPALPGGRAHTQLAARDGGRAGWVARLAAVGTLVVLRGWGLGGACCPSPMLPGYTEAQAPGLALAPAGLRPGLIRPGLLYRAAMEGATFSLVAGMQRMQDFGVAAT